jgi:hypothetical protein
MKTIIKTIAMISLASLAPTGAMAARSSSEQAAFMRHYEENCHELHKLGKKGHGCSHYWKPKHSATSKPKS